MIAISSQDFRNAYEKFYNDVRRYLWPFDIIKELSEVEVDIYQAFIDVDKLRVDFARLCKSMKEVLSEDDLLSEDADRIQKLLDDESPSSYLRIPQVNESNPENNKQIKTIPDEKEEELI